MSTNQIAPALQKTKYCRLAGIVTGTPAKAEHWKAQYKIPDANIYNYDTMDQMIHNPDIDVVYVVTPNALHAEHTIKAAQAGKHVLCEKPMEISTDKCQQMIAACRQAGKQLAIGYRLIWEPNNRECVRLARREVFGKVKVIQASFGFRIGDPKQWRLNRSLSGGGPLMDVGIYAIQAARQLMASNPVLVTATTSNTNPAKFKDVEESLVWQMQFPNGAMAHCSTSYAVNGMAGYQAYAENGWFQLDDAFGYSGQHGLPSDGQIIALEQSDQFAEEMDNFAQCIIHDQTTDIPGEEGLADVKIMMGFMKPREPVKRY